MIGSALPDSFVTNAENKQPPIIQMTRGRKIVISLYLLFYYTIAGFWNSPPGALKDFMVNNLRVVADIFAFEQTWNMFGPPCRTWNGHFFATITFADGSTRICELPRMEKMDLWEKFRREKLRKLFIDNLPGSQFARYLPGICASLAEANNDPKNPPVTVCLTFKWVNMPEPDEKQMTPTNEFPIHNFSRTDIVYRVQPEDLK